MATNSFEYFLGRRNAACVRLLETNHDVAHFMQGMLEQLVDYASKEGIDFATIKIDRPFITHDGYIRGRVAR